MNQLTRQCLAEAIGTFYLCFIGAGAICISQDHDIGLLGIALAHGLALSVAVTATMNISGGQLNPAVSIALFITKKLDAQRMVAFIVSQLAGAVVAGFLLRWIFAKYVGVEPYIGTPTISVEPLQAVVIEAVLTFLLVFSIFGTAIDPRAPKVGGFGIGLTVAFDILVGGPLTGAAMNPARFTGIGLAAGHLDNLWIYWVGPVVGGTLAAILYTKFLLEDKKQG